MARKRPFTPEELEARRLKQKEYNSRPEVIERRKEYYRRPEVQARYLARREAGAQTEYLKQWRSSEHGKRVLKKSGLRQRGFTLELWDALLSSQGKACAICKTPFSEPRDIHADHCHSSKIHRGLLCQACNHAEGQIRKTGLSPEEFGRRLSEYLGNPPAARVGSEPNYQDTLDERT